MSDITDRVVILLGGKEVVLDPANFEFNESTISKYFTLEYSWYNYFGQKLAEAEAYVQLKECEYDVKFAEKFIQFKDEAKCSDKMAESRANAEQEVIDAEKAIIAAKLKVRQLQQHLRAWDKNHDNAQSLGYMLRKEMDKLNNDIKMSKSDLNLESQVDAIINSSWNKND